jgi:WD40 repeat protein
VIPTFFSPDGKRVIGAGYPSGTVQVWDTATGKQLHTLRTPRGYRRAGDYVLPAPDGRTVYVPVEKIKVVRSEKDGKRVFGRQYDGEIQVWDLATGRRRPSLRHEPGRGELWSSLSPDGRSLLVVEMVNDGGPGKAVLTLWDVQARAPRQLAEGYWVHRFAPDGKTFAACSSDHRAKRSVLKLWDADTGKERFVLGEARDAYFGVPAFSPDGRYVAASLGTPRETPPAVRLWDVATGQEAGGFVTPEKGWYLRTLAFSPDGRRLAAASDEGRLFLYDVPARKLARVHAVGTEIGLREPVFSPDGKTLAVAGMEIPKEFERASDPDPFDLPQPRVFLFDVISGGPPEVLVCPHGYVGQLAFSPDGRTLALGSYGCVLLFDVGR